MESTVDMVADDDAAVAGQLARRRRDVAAAWELGDEVVLIGAGARLPIPGRADLTYPFRSHSEYLYLTDLERPGGVLAFDPQDGWVDFVAPVTRDEQVWEGASEEDAQGTPVERLEPWLAARAGRPVGCLGAPVPGVAGDDALQARLRRALNGVRRRKDAVELARMRRAERATKAGFTAVVPLIEPGRTERELQVELEAAFLRDGADALAFDTIIGGGPHSAVLHFPPTPRPLGDGELVLIDAGGEYRGYASDVTRTYPASGRFTGEQAELHEVVRAACAAAIGACAAGTEFRDVHGTAARVIAEGLAGLGVLRGDPDELVARGAVALFMPHGVGHMLGLGVRDAGEVLPGRTPPPGFPALRIDLPLERGHVVTIEPGIYFVPALLRDGELRDRHRDDVVWERVERLMTFGGIRIEHNVLVADDGPEVLTSDIPLA